MTSSQVKRAIDETIGEQPLMNEAFIQKVVQHKGPKKPLAFLQPVIVFLLMLAIGATLYFTPGKNEHSAVEISEQYLTDQQTKLLEQYYSAIASKDQKALENVATMSTAEVIKRYEAFDFTKGLEVVKTIDAENELTLFVKLSTANDALLEKLLLDKASNKFVLTDGYEFSYYEQEVELPKTISLKYKVAPIATPMENPTIYPLENAEKEKIDGNTLYQIETKKGVRRIFETFSGQRFDLGIVSEGMTYYSAGDYNQFYLVDSLTTMMTYIYLNQQGDYQIVTGELGEREVTTYQTEVVKEPFLIMSGEKPKIVTIQDGQLVYADFLKQADFENPIEFYSTESQGAMLLVKYTEDVKQTSSSYELTSMNVLENSALKDIWIAKPIHLQTMWLTQRYNGQLQYQFDDGTLYFRNNDRVNGTEEPTFGHDPIWPETIEKTYTNIKIETKGNQYFITGDNGFKWTLTRIAPRIFKDDKGIEYTVTMDIDKLSESLK
jgi:hypothetical protein